jgi:serine/threonine protein kinase
MDRERIGKYTIVGELGRGTMGEVYKAHDPVLNRYVALKTLPARAGPDDETLQRFQREAQAAALLNHPNIVTVHDFGQERGLLYMAMELLEGIDLREAVDSDRLGTLEEKLDVMDSVLAALDYAHAKGVVHRDIKPANIHLGKNRQVKIMDFGLARVSTSEMTQEGIVLGTPNYMSPEQALGDKVDGRSDLFSTGAVLYELLTGHKPFEADTTPSVLFQVVHKQPPPVRRWAPDLPASIVAVVNRALEKDLARRFGSAGDMRAALAIAREGLAPGRPAPPPLPAAPPQPSHSQRLAPPPLPPTAAPASRSSGPGSVPPARSHSERPGSSSGIASPPARPTSIRPLLIGAGLAVLALISLAAGLWLRERSAAPTPAPAPAATATAATGALTQELASKQLRLAQVELEDKNYSSALAEARGVLKLSPGHEDALAVVAAAEARLVEIDQAIASAKRLLEAGDSEAASRELSRLLELDPRHTAVADLTGQLNGVFRAQAEAAAGEMRAARDAAVKAQVAPWALRSADAAARKADESLSRGEFAEATRLFLETRDALDRSRRAASSAAAGPRQATAGGPTGATPAARPATTPRTTATVTPERVASTPGPARSFSADATSVSGSTSGGPAGFDGVQLAGRAIQFSGGVEFEVLPSAVRPGDPFVIRIHLRNDGRRSVKIRELSLSTVIDGRRVSAPAKPLLREVPPATRGLVAEYSAVWSAPREWLLEAVVTADKNETVTSRLKAN